MSVGIVRYPGSNCDFDALNYFDNSFFIWHTEQEFPESLQLLIIPGGFAFGDRLYDKATDRYVISPGTMATDSPVTSIIMEAVQRKIPILGICNGFQILIQLNLLPGVLLLNDNHKFTCKKVKCAAHFEVDNKLNEFPTELFIANSYGKYSCSDEEYQQLKENDQIFFTYQEEIPEMNSLHNIAGICNKDRTIYGMMPHPERNNTNFKTVLYKMIFPNDNKVQTQLHFQKKIIELMHSEHISYKSTRKYLKRLYTLAPWVIQGPGENAGIVDIGNGYCIALRIESHNHPTFIDPFEGAATGVGGIMRDIFTMGARPIAILDFLRFGTDDHSAQLLEKAIDGISYYGNCVGVPNVGGDLYKHSSYNKNPLVNVGCIGIVKKKNIIYGSATNSKQLLVYVGSKTGNEGIGGAAMASNAFNSDTNVDSMQHNVQKSDPYLEKLLLEACCEIAENHLAVGMQDMGAGGLLCASHEIVKRGGEKTQKHLGCKIDMAKVPTKYEMDPCNILISESQERMLIVTDEERVEKIYEIFKKWDLEYAQIGEMTMDGRYSIYKEDKLLYTEEICNHKDITENWPLVQKSQSYTVDLLNRDKENDPEKIKNKELWKVYDSTVGNRTLKGPDQDGSYSIINIPEINNKLYLTWGETFNTCFDQMNALGGKALCVVNCLNFGHPKDSITDFVQTVEELTNACRLFKVPVVGGNVSLYNSTDEKSIRPTPVILMLGLHK